MIRMRKLVLSSAREHMDKTMEHIRHEFSTIRTGRASTALLDGITVDYYGSPTALNQLANISVPDAKLLMVTPYDKGGLKDIEKALLKSDLGLTPANDGKVIRIPIPDLTEERRKDLVKVIRRLAEDSKVSLRNIRRDSNDVLKKAEKDGELPEDESHSARDEVQKVTDGYVKKIDELLKAKEDEVMEV
jgi:ribosome recycling factor